MANKVKNLKILSLANVGDSWMTLLSYVVGCYVLIIGMVFCY